MYKIEFKDGNKYTGEYGPLTFVDGVTSTDNAWLASWFEGKEFVVTKLQKNSLNKLTVEQLKELVTEKGIEFDSKIKKADLIELLETAEGEI